MTIGFRLVPTDTGFKPSLIDHKTNKKFTPMDPSFRSILANPGTRLAFLKAQ
jgi:hypothetical protein